jgi:ElaB/YqjD/DUF883 family membrane-anchored ribosome-binding protein
MTTEATLKKLCERSEQVFSEFNKNTESDNRSLRDRMHRRGKQGRFAVSSTGIPNQEHYEY